MTRQLLFLLALVIIPLALRGQSTISVEPSTFVLTGNPNQTDIPYHIQVTNTSSEVVSIYWSKRMTNNPTVWFSWICDKVRCYLPDFSSNPPDAPNILQPNESMDFQIHMNPSLTEGTGDYEVRLLDDMGNVLATINGQIVIDNSTAVKDANDSKLTVFPNPAVDFFQVSETPGLKGIELFNIVGNKVRSFETAPGKQYYVGDLNNGIYLVRLVSSTKKVLKTIRLSKR